jgi:pimeloyl-ACP methyl ester carboxylesterase
MSNEYFTSDKFFHFMKTVYSLIVAIDEYPNPRHCLNGCKNDATAFSNYLTTYAQSRGYKYQEKRLFDADAKRLNIIEGFNHLKAATDDDVCVLYYSGHGSQMAAPPEFWDEQDRRSETLVCWDSRNPGGRDLIDKELATLIWSVTNEKDLHFLAVMDCCHSGSNTREIEVKSRMAEPSSFIPRDVSGYYGKEVWDNFQPPVSRHVHLAAAKDSETAKELKINDTPRGAFTYNLIKALEQTGATISYDELITRVGQNVRNLVREQTPQCNAYKVTTDTTLTFMGAATKKGEYLISHDNKEGWIVNIGGVQGVPASGATFVLKDGREIAISEVKANFSKVGGMELSNVEEQYIANLKNIDNNPLELARLKVAFAADSEKAGDDFFKERLKLVPSKAIEIVENEANADYVIRSWDNAYRLCKRGDTVPLFRRIEGYNIMSAQGFIQNIETVSKWCAKLALDNPLSKINDNEFEVVVKYIDGKDMKMPYVLAQADADHEARIQVGIKNIGTRSFWVSALYIGSDFSVSNEFLPKKEIKPTEIAWIEYQNKPNVPFIIQKEYLSWGVNEIQEYFKIFISTDPIDTSIHNQEGLQLDMRGGATRVIGTATPSVPSNDWRTILLPITVVCPMEKVKLIAGRALPILDATIEAPQGFTAQINLAASEQATRDISDTPILRGGYGMSSAAFVEGMGSSPLLDVLELNNVTGSISPKNPLKIKLNTIKEDEIVLPFAFDAETSLYLPLGMQDENGMIQIHHLPEGKTDGVERGLLGSAASAVKIYFKKIIKPILGKYDYPLLRMAVFKRDTEDFTYEDKIETIKKKVDKAQNILLIVHGLIGSTSDHTKGLARAAKTKGKKGIIGNYDMVLTFDYESLNTPLETTANDLEKRLLELGLKKGMGKRLDVMAHSMGGLVTRFFVEKGGGQSFVKNVYLFGVPNNGSHLAELRDMIAYGITLAVNGFTVFQPYVLPLSLLSKGLSKLMVTISQLNPNSPFIADLNNAPDTGIPYYTTAGNIELLKDKNPQQHRFYQKVIKSVKRTPDELVNRLFGEPNDLAVQVSSVKSVGKQTNVRFKEIACDHYSFFEAPEGLEALAEVVK